jgi:hypothetical protein
MCVVSLGGTTDFEVFEELVDLCSMQDQTEGLDLIQ